MNPLALARSLKDFGADLRQLVGPAYLVSSKAFGSIPAAELAGLRAELAWRRDAMVRQVPASGVVLLLAARPGLPATPGLCWSCGGQVPAGSSPAERCLLCSTAAGAALEDGRRAPTFHRGAP